MGTILSFRQRPRLRSAQLRMVDEIRVVATQSHRIELLVDFRERIDGVAFLRDRDARWWVGGISARVVRAETAKFIDQVHIVLEPEDMAHQRFFGSVDWNAEIPDEFTQDPSSPKFDAAVHAEEAQAYTGWINDRSITVVCTACPGGRYGDDEPELVASVVHPQAVAADWFNARNHRLRTGLFGSHAALCGSTRGGGPHAA